MVEIKLKIPRTPNDSNPINLPLKNGDQLFIVGANGSGKSALILKCMRLFRPQFRKVKVG